MPRGDTNPDFTDEERKRLMKVCRALRTSYKEFIHFATMQSISECEGFAQDADAIFSYYESQGEDL